MQKSEEIRAEGPEEEEKPEIPEEELARRARLRCMKLLEYMDRTEAQLRRKLKESGFPQAAEDGAIEYVRQFHYLDDRRYAENYVLQNSGKKSIRQMTQELQQKGVSREDIEEALENSGSTEEEACARLLQKRAQGRDLTQEKVRWGLVRYLTGKGFPYDLSRRLVQEYDRVTSEEEGLDNRIQMV